MPKRDEFDDPEGFFGRLITVKSGSGGSMFENKSLWLSIGVFAVVVALSGVIWASYPSQNPLVGDGAVPVIRADAEPYKHVPDDRGGMPIAHRDSTVFAAMRGDDTDQKVENLLDDTPAEKPVDRAQLFAGLKTDLAAVAAATAPTSGTPQNLLQPDGKTPTGTTTATTPGTAPGPTKDGKDTKPVQVARMGDYAQDRPLTEQERRTEAAERNTEMLGEPAAPLPQAGQNDAPPVPTVAPVDEPAETTPVVSASKGLQEPHQPDVPKPTGKGDKSIAKTGKTDKGDKGTKQAKGPDVKVTTGKGSSYVQVASVPLEGLVKSEFATVSSKLPMIAGLPYRVQKADVKGKGTFHRIQVGPMSVDDANKLCTAIKTRKPGGCLVVK